MIRRTLLILTTLFFYGAVGIFRPLLRWKAGVSSGYSCIGKDCFFIIPADGDIVSGMERSTHADHILLLAIIGLCLFGFIMVASASAVIAERFQGDPYYFVKHQVFYGGTVGLVLGLVGFFTPYKYWKYFALPGLLLALALLVLVFVPGLQVHYGGASRWIGIGPITLQPTEITKLAVIVYLAALFSRKGEDIKDFKKSVLPFLIIFGMIVFLIMMQPDMGTLISITIIAGSIIYISGVRIWHLMIILLLAASLFAIFLNTADYRLDRIIVYLHPELDPQGVGYQINQAMLAVGTGGWWGQGLGRSRQKYHYLPEPAGDSVFAIVAEEMGFIRSLLVLGAFALVGWRGYQIARGSPDMFGRLLAVGVTSWILIQAYINIGSILGLSPMTGIPLPFISYGGSALATLLLAAGILLNVSKFVEE